MILDTTLISLKAILAGSVSANQPFCHVDYSVWDVSGVRGKPGTFRVALNGTSDVIILPAPKTQGQVYDPEYISIYNKDTAPVTVFIKTDDGTTQGIIAHKTLATLESAHWSKKSGWYVLNA